MTRTFGPARARRQSLVRVFIAARADVAFVNPIIGVDRTAPTVAPLYNSQEPFYERHVVLLFRVHTGRVDLTTRRQSHELSCVSAAKED